MAILNPDDRTTFDYKKSNKLNTLEPKNEV